MVKSGDIWLPRDHGIFLNDGNSNMYDMKICLGLIKHKCSIISIAAISSWQLWSLYRGMVQMCPCRAGVTYCSIDMACQRNVYIV